MIPIKQVRSSSLYILCGKAVAKNPFFEEPKDVLLAHRFAKRFLEPIMDIIEYNFTKDGWIFIVKTKSATSILSAYTTMRLKSKKAKEAHRKQHIPAIISEHMRLFLSVLIRAMNRRSGRTGTKVHSVFERYIFESKEEYDALVSLIQNEKINLCHQQEKYRPDYSEVDGLNDELGVGSRKYCSKKRIKNRTKNLYLIDYKPLTKDVLQQAIKSLNDFNNLIKSINLSYFHTSPPP